MNLQPTMIANGLRFELIFDPPWTIYRHVSANGAAWDVAQHAEIRERGEGIWQVFMHCNGRSRVLTSRWGDDIGPLYECNVHDLGAMVQAAATHISISAHSHCGDMQPQATAMQVVSE